MITTEDLCESIVWGASVSGRHFYIISLNVNVVCQCIMHCNISFRYRKMNSAGGKKKHIQNGFDLTRMVLLNKCRPIHLKDNLLKEPINKGLFHSKH